MPGEWIFWQLLLLTELYVSAITHLVYALTVFFAGIKQDLKSLLLSGNEESSRVLPIVDSALEIASESNLVSVDADHRQSNLDCKDSTVPIVLLHGIFGFGKGKLGGISYWAGAEKKDDKVLTPDLGSLTSIHDRACELFYFLKGGTVDYGVEHSCKYGHPRFGRTYEQGHYPEWDEKNPVHLVGHSSGAQVARVLQQMLADKEFPGHDSTSADWVLSITSLSGALNGTTRVYIDGIRAEDGCTLRSICLLQLCRIGSLIYEWLDIPHLKRYYGFGFDHFDLQWHKAGVTGLALAIAGYWGPYASGDWILPDLSLQATAALNSRIKTHPNTYYISYATKRTTRAFGKTIPSSLMQIHPLLLLRTLEMCLWCHPSHLPPPFEGYRDADWQDNDGALNTISMLYPRFPVPHPHCLMESLNGNHTLKPGIWYYTVIEADHILFVVDRDRAGEHFDIVYDSIFQRCRKHMVKSGTVLTSNSYVSASTNGSYN